MRKLLSLFVLSLCLPAMLRGQTVDSLSSIVGKTYRQMEVPMSGPQGGTQVYDVPIPGIDVVLISGGDTLRTKTDAQGRFNFSGIASRAVRLSMVDDGYAPFSESFTLTPGENIVIVPRQQKAETLDAASVSAERPIMTMKGDTLVYHAAAMTVREGDYAVDLLAQMPGVEVDALTGQIRISGKEVARSYVNGALIFGLNPMDPMRNLRAEQVETMEVYDETDPQEVIDRVVREKQRVVNITTKEPIFDATDLQVRAIAGADEIRREDGKRQYRYSAGTNAHFFSELLQLSADVVTGNVGMTTSDIAAVPVPQSTYRSNTGLDLGFNKYWENPLFGNALNTRYSYTLERSKSRRRALQEYFETAGVPAHTTEDESSSARRLASHRFETGVAYRTWDLATVTWRQTFSLSRTESDVCSTGATLYGDRDPMLRDETSFTGNKNWNLSESLNINFKSDGGTKPGPSLAFSVMLRNSDMGAWNLDTLASSYTRRYLTKDGKDMQQLWLGSIRHVLVENRQGRQLFQLTGMYTLSYQLQNRTQEAFDLYGTDVPAVNPANTFDFTYSYLDHELNFSARYDAANEKVPRLNIGANFRMSRVIDRERLPSSVAADKTYFTVNPTLSVIFRRMAFSVGSGSSVPAVEQIRRRIDDTQPLSLAAGNPDLKMSNFLNLQWSWGGSALRASKWTTTGSARLRYDIHPFVQRTLFYREETVLPEYDGYRVPAGATLLRTENADYDLSGNISFNLSSRLSLLGGKLRPTLTFKPQLDYRLQPQYFGEVLDCLTEWTPAVDATVTAPLWTSAQATLKGAFAYIRATSSAGSMDRKAIRASLDADFKTEFLRYGFFSGVYSWRPVRDLSTPSMGRDYHQLDLAVGINLLKKDLKISLRGIDLLRSGSVYTLTMNPSSVSHTWAPVYGRYFVLDISYRFNNSGGRSMPRYPL